MTVGGAGGSAWAEWIHGARREDGTRIHDPETLTKIAFVHTATDITQLTANGVQARAWAMLVRMCTMPAPPGCDAGQAASAAIGFYSALFDLDPTEVCDHLRGLGGRSRPG